MSGGSYDKSLADVEIYPTCTHNVIRRKRKSPDLYVCGSCAKLFTVQVRHEPSIAQEPMFDRRPPWGLRSRQA